MLADDYWIWIRNSSFNGNLAAAGGTANNASAILMDGTLGNGVGLTYIDDTQLANGGIKFIPGTDGGSVFVKNTTIESSSTPLLWFTNWNSAVYGSIEDSISADGSGPTVENDGPGPGPVVTGKLAGVQGPATQLGGFNSATSSALKQGQVGVIDNYLVGESDVARRISTLVPTRFTNLAYSNTASWAVVAGSMTITSGVADPFGGTGAATLTASSTGVVQMSPLNTKTSAPGDWAMWGMWIQGTPPYFPTIGCPGYGGFNYSASYGTNGPGSNDGQWNYAWFAGKVTSGGNACLSIQVASGTSVTVYGPTEYYVTNGTISDNEALEFASNSNSVDTACPVGLDLQCDRSSYKFRCAHNSRQPIRYKSFDFYDCPNHRSLWVRNHGCIYSPQQWNCGFHGQCWNNK